MSITDNINKYIEGWGNDCGYDYDSDDYKCVDTNCPCIIRWIVEGFLCWNGESESGESNGFLFFHRLAHTSVGKDFKLLDEILKYNRILPDFDKYLYLYAYIDDLIEHFYEWNPDIAGEFDYDSSIVDSVPMIKLYFINKCIGLEKIKESIKHYINYNHKDYTNIEISKLYNHFEWLTRY